MFSFCEPGIQGVTKLEVSLQLAISTYIYDDTKTCVTHDRTCILTNLLHNI